MTHQVSEIVHSMTPKLEHSGAFTIPCTIGSADFAKALCDLRASINLLPYLVFKPLGIGKPRPTSMRLQMADHTMKRPLGIIDDVLVRVDKFILPADFVILDWEVDYDVPIILGRPFLDTGKTLVDVEAGELTSRVGDEKVVFHVCKSMRQPNINEGCSFVEMINVIIDDASATMNVEDNLEAIMLNLDNYEEKEGYVKCVNALQGIGSYTYEPRRVHIGGTTKEEESNWMDIGGYPGHKPRLLHAQYYFGGGDKPSIEHQMRLNKGMQEVLQSILIAPEDQEKTTFTCPYGTFAFSWMPFGLCNTPMTFQRCMLAIFTNMVEDILDVFMDDFSTVGNSFDDCLNNLDKVLARWSEKFLGSCGVLLPIHQGFSKVVNPLCKLLEEDAKFHFNEDFMKAFELLKFKLTTTPIIIAPNWSLPFELMCDASDVVVGAVLGKIINKIFHPVYYASKIMNDAQVNYTVTEKELLAIVFAMEKSAHT
ncbi:uncharacterized protein [Nicotiana sylvestris]|uniref:uncharacterized protein n=1 Tax=Nicotiana sylvestris TaxID=4096 RepID=UPI00388C8E22